MIMSMGNVSGKFESTNLSGDNLSREIGRMRHLEGDREVLQVHRGHRLHGGREADAVQRLVVHLGSKQ